MSAFGARETIPERNLYLLCVIRGEQRQNLGLFSSLSKTLTFLRRFPKKNEYVIYRIPVNSELCTRRKFVDVHKKYFYWVLGTSEELVIKMDEDHNLKKEAYLETIQRWPGCKPKILKRERIDETQAHLRQVRSDSHH